MKKNIRDGLAPEAAISLCRNCNINIVFGFFTFSFNRFDAVGYDRVIGHDDQTPVARAGKPSGWLWLIRRIILRVPLNAYTLCVRPERTCLRLLFQIRAVLWVYSFMTVITRANHIHTYIDTPVGECAAADVFSDHQNQLHWACFDCTRRIHPTYSHVMCTTEVDGDD